MKLGQIHKLGVDLGIKNDLRGFIIVQTQIKERQKKFQGLTEEEKNNFNTELLTNPYADSQLEFGDPNREVKKVLAGIDIETAEVLLADRIGNVDLIVAHHPQGKSKAGLNEVMHLQTEVLEKLGVPINIAQGIMRERINEIGRRLHSGNHWQAIDAAKLLGIAFICEHTTCDNIAATFITNALRKAKPKTVHDIIKTLKTIPEYQRAAEYGVQPRVFAGSASNYCGKVVVTGFTGGTSGSKLMYERLAHAGVGTIISMHLGEEHRTEAERNHLNVVVAGHMSSDSLGMNLFLDELEKRGVEIVPTSGLIRVPRNKPVRKRAAAARKPQTKRRTRK